jgi:hypothetical protein
MRRFLTNGDPCTIVYDPRDATHAEPAYTQRSAPRPTVSVAISVVVALFVILLTFPYFFALGLLPQIAAPYSANCIMFRVVRMMDWIFHPGGHILRRLDLKD